MAWPDLYITGSGEFVNEATQLNNNWVNIDQGFTTLVGEGINSPGGTVLGGTPVAGMEWVSTEGDHYTYNGSAWIPDEVETWGAWQSMNTEAPYVSRPADPLRIRVSSLKNVEMTGALQPNADPTVGFPTTGYQLVHQHQFGAGYLPEITSVFPAAMQQVTTGFAHGQIYVTVNSLPSQLAIYVLPQGTRDTANNFILFDQVRYKAA